MCGIIGYFAKGKDTPAPDLFDRTVDALRHRGPDHRGVWSNAQVGLGFRRLSIIDLESGSQPMANENGSLRLVFNGEIYNFQDLRTDLIRKGHRFQTRSDTETILHLYEEEQADCVKRLHGMFAFALYDGRQNSLLLARDRFGKKPLVYTETPAGFFFSSEIPPLLDLAGCPREASIEAIDAYLALRYVPSPLTAWRNVHRLQAASTLAVKNGCPSEVRRYWRLVWTPSPSTGPMEEQTAAFRQQFEESVRLRLVSDVPLGAFLSGGVDSSVTVAAMTQAGSRVKTFCIGFSDSRFDESPFAREIARRLGTDHHELTVEPDSMEALPSLLTTMGEPFADQSLLPTHAVAAFTRQQVTVALSGDGGDELFAGYKRYHHLGLADFMRRLGLRVPWLGVSRALFGFEQIFNPKRRKLEWPRSALDRLLQIPSDEGFRELMTCWPSANRRQFLKNPPSLDRSIRFFSEKLASLPHLAPPTLWQALDVETYLTDDILRKVDTASMACSLECRCPFLDHSLAEQAAALPVAARWNLWGGGKTLLKQLYPKQLPSSLFDRPKKGFSMPIGNWMRKQWKPIMEESIEGAWTSGLESAFQRQALRQLWKEHQQGQQDHGERLWAWLTLWKWDEIFRPDWNV
ncbi:MAG: asparagine synthase (glutamine-hydrolyzing) [Verrucomicrobiae bacterium]|nr:asparagine synthase (glutamine-hydrolyzing) [Verrucomicrobiae bacterium]